MPAPAESRIALFLDFENLVTNTGISAAEFDLQPALDRLLEKGKVVFRRAYCDWSRFNEAKAALHTLGVELIDVPPSTRAGKNSADIRLVIDALELCYAREHIDTFVIASGDSDFCALASKLRENNRIVIGLAVKRATSPMFVKACDEFLYLNSAHFTSEAREPKDTEGSARRKGREKPAKAAPVVPAFARDVVARLIEGASGPINPSAVKSALMRKEPDFDERDHGFSTFGKLLTALETEGLLRRELIKRQWYVLPPDLAEPASSEEPTPPSPDKEAAAPPEEKPSA